MFKFRISHTGVTLHDECLQSELGGASSWLASSSLGEESPSQNATNTVNFSCVFLLQLYRTNKISSIK